MRTPRARRLYMGGLVVLVLGFIVVGAWAITLLLRGAPAYPVRVTGAAEFPAADHVERTPLHSSVILALQGVRGFEDLPSGGHDPAAPTPDARRDPAPQGSAVAAAAGAPADGSRAVTVPLLQRAEARVLESARAAAAEADWPRALTLYSELGRRHPDAAELVHERADVLAWAGRHEEAGRLYRELAGRAADYAALLAAARNLWWGGRALAADSALVEYLARRPGDPEAEALLAEVRGGASPPLGTAERWAAERSRPLEQLLLARALVAEMRYEEALPVYRRALDAGAADSIWLELASTAAAADSGAVAATAMRAWLERSPEDRRTRIALARALAWAGRYPEAIAEFETVLRAAGDPELAFERAQLLTWSGREDEARRALAEVVAERPDHALAHQMLADLAAWRGEWETAVTHYRAALRQRPESAEMAALLADAEVSLRLAQRGAPPVERTAMSLEAFSDRSGFRWVEARAEQSLRAGYTGFRILALQTMAARAFNGQRSTAPGVAGRLEVVHPFSARWEIEAGAGVAAYETARFPDLFAAVRFSDVVGLGVEVRMTHEPAVRRATTLLALHARTMATRGEATVTATRGAYSLWSRASVERFDSDLGSGTRQAAAITTRRPVIGQLSAVVGINATATDGPSPLLAGWGSIWWAPELYVQPTAGLGWDAVRGNWQLSATTLGGYAFVRERAEDRRFAGSRFPAFSAGADLAWRAERWTVAAGVQHGGAFDGYRATTVRVNASYRLR